MEPQGKFLGDPIPYSELTIGVMKETYPGECRVSQSPESVKTLVDAGFDVVVQAGGKKKFSIDELNRDNLFKEIYTLRGTKLSLHYRSLPDTKMMKNDITYAT